MVHVHHSLLHTGAGARPLTPVLKAEEMHRYVTSNTSLPLGGKALAHRAGGDFFCGR